MNMELEILDEVTTKLCYTCNTIKDTKEFYKCSRDGLQSKCIECGKKYNIDNIEKRRKQYKKYYNSNRKRKIEYQRNWVLLNKEKSVKYKRDWKLKNEYGITEEEFNRLFKEQGECCAICKSKSSANIKTDKLYIDHDHKTGKVRGLLCNLCNNGLGRFKDSIENLNNAIEYLKIHNG